MNLILELFIFLFGVSIGSFLNVLIDRLPQERKITGRSVCEYCQHQLAWYCRKKISFHYPLVEILTGLMFIFVFLTYVKNIQEISLWQKWLVILSLWGIVSCFIVIFFSDAKYHLISDYILWALFGFSFFLKLFYHSTEILKQFQIDIFSSLIVAFPIWLIYFLSKEKAMGLGDVYLAAILDFFLVSLRGNLILLINFNPENNPAPDVYEVEIK